MLKYISIPLSSNCDSYCNYHKAEVKEVFIDSNVLSKIVIWAMKENLSIQFVYPNSPLPIEVERVIDSVDHTKIVSETICDKKILSQADIIISNNFCVSTKIHGKIYVIRTNLSNFLNSADSLKKILSISKKVNIVFTDIENFCKEKIANYNSVLSEISRYIASEYIDGRCPQFNLITDRILLSEMNNCNAGHETISVSIDGKFYPCPAFIGDEHFNCGDINVGVKIPNQYLYNIKYAPICKVCDAYHCKRCVWLNYSLTHEVNTPGWQQCYMSHIEREASVVTLESIQAKKQNFLKDKSIQHLNYLDPFTKIELL